MDVTCIRPSGHGAPSGAATSARADVALFLPDLRGGGAERVSVILANGLAARGYATDLVLASDDGPLGDVVSSEVLVTSLGSERARSAVLPLIRYLRSRRPRALLSGLPQANVVAALARRLSGVPCRLVLCEHNSISQKRRHKRTMGDRILRACMRTVYPWADDVVAVSRGAADELSSFLRRPVKAIPNPVVDSNLHARAGDDGARSRIRQGDGALVLAAGRLDAQKDFETLLRAFARLRAQHPARLLILGEGPERRSLERLASHLGVADDVAMPGFVDNPYVYMAAADVVALTSRYEGLPTVLIEALALGRPIVATDCPHGPREILADGRFGRLVPVADVDALTQAVLATLHEPDRPVPDEAWYPYTADAATDRYVELLFADAIDTKTAA